MDDLQIVKIDNPREYFTDLRDCITCIKYLKENNMYEDQRIGILCETIPGYAYFPKGSYVLFKENKQWNLSTYIVEKPFNVEEIKEKLYNNAIYGFVKGFTAYKLVNVPESFVKDAIINYKE